MPSHITRGSFTAPVIDYEPAPAPVTGPCPPPSPAALHRRTPRPLRPAPAAPPAAPRPAALFADTVLRRVLEVIDRRRPAAQLRPLLTPPLLAMVGTHARLQHAAPARLRRVRLRAAGSGSTAAEVFATYVRGERVRAIAARVELVGPDRWQLVALQIG
jgi:Family of unknown function (DUF6459)